MTTVTRTRDLVLALVALRLVLVAMAIVAIYTGYSLLTSPLMVPLTFGIWLSAVLMLVLAIAAKLPADSAGEDGVVQQPTRRRAA